eukprot:TRINITY_DN4329_c0_g1_i1.p1 TRINITY_DN4329_c0_g1~~TRINITY_DN4329_c0_g1_i1.p1  ORF type:complete len:175 (-),score=22.58 TRINITY_DN4329_c0_g1_i1:82-606(-)
MLATTRQSGQIYKDTCSIVCEFPPQMNSGVFPQYTCYGPCCNSNLTAPVTPDGFIKSPMIQSGVNLKNPLAQSTKDLYQPGKSGQSQKKYVWDVVESQNFLKRQQRVTVQETKNGIKKKRRNRKKKKVRDGERVFLRFANRQVCGSHQIYIIEQKFGSLADMMEGRALSSKRYN